jgi:hypothetical protein
MRVWLYAIAIVLMIFGASDFGTAPQLRLHNPSIPAKAGDAAPSGSPSAEAVGRTSGG